MEQIWVATRREKKGRSVSGNRHPHTGQSTLRHEEGHRRHYVGENLGPNPRHCSCHNDAMDERPIAQEREDDTNTNTRRRQAHNIRTQNGASTLHNRRRTVSRRPRRAIRGRISAQILQLFVYPLHRHRNPRVRVCEGCLKRINEKRSNSWETRNMADVYVYVLTLPGLTSFLVSSPLTRSGRSLVFVAAET